MRLPGHNRKGAFTHWERLPIRARCLTWPGSRISRVAICLMSGAPRSTTTPRARAGAGRPSAR